MKKIILIISLLLISGSSFAAENSEVLTTIKPVHSLVLAITKGSGINVDLLVKGTNSPHGYQLKPSQLAQINNAKIIFYIDKTFETFLYKALKNTSSNVQKIAFSETPGIKILPLRNGGLWEEDTDEKEAQTEISKNDGVVIEDMHIFLTPENAKLMAGKIVETLSSKYPDKKMIFMANYKALSSRLDALDSKIRTELAPVKNRPFIVFHDAFQYFTKAYELNNIGSITVEPDQPLKPKRIEAIQEKIRSSKVVCVFTEPQFSDKMVNKLIAGTAVKSQPLDPEAIALKPSENLYFQVLENITDDLRSCLSR